MVKRMLGANGQSATSLSRESGVSIPSLIRWKREACTISEMTTTKDSKRSQDWTPLEVMRALVETAEMGDDELGKYLRSRGLHEKTLKEWREDAEANFGKHTRKQRAKKSVEQKEIRRLSSELRRKDAALAEAAALLVLKKKLSPILGLEDEETE